MSLTGARPAYFVIDDCLTANELDLIRQKYTEQVKPWQKRHDKEVKGQLLFVEPRYRNYPVMHKEDL